MNPNTNSVDHPRDITLDSVMFDEMTYPSRTTTVYTPPDKVDTLVYRAGQFIHSDKLNSVDDNRLDEILNILKSEREIHTHEMVNINKKLTELENRLSSVINL